MYLNSRDYQTVWQLAHGWAGKDSVTSDPGNLSAEVIEAIHRILIAIRNKLISVRTPFRVIFLEEKDFVDTLFELPSRRHHWHGRAKPALDLFNGHIITRNTSVYFVRHSAIAAAREPQAGWQQ
ncbi:MAG: hypothetical protein HY016_05925 [Nitrosomonadales bacterium]|nr:hypothetical protein [Nitrosomonadales bacterium]